MGGVRQSGPVGQDGAKEKAAITASAFHLDCTDVLEECGCSCARCVEEMRCVFGALEGVKRFYRHGPGVVVEHDPGVVRVETLMDVFRGIPSFYSRRFVPSVMEGER